MIDLSLRIGLMLGATAMIGAGVLEFGHHERSVGRQEVQSKWDAEKASRQTVVITRQADVIQQNAAKDHLAEKVDNHAQDQLKTALADRDRAVRAASSLRDELAAVRADAMSETTTRARLAAELAATADSFGECSTRYSALAEQSDRLSIQVSGLLALAPQ